MVDMLSLHRQGPEGPRGCMSGKRPQKKWAASPHHSRNAEQLHTLPLDENE